jgi:hypothetical protein
MPLELDVRHVTTFRAARPDGFAPSSSPRPPHRQTIFGHARRFAPQADIRIFLQFVILAGQTVVTPPASPWRRTSPSGSRQQRDPVTAAAKLTVISEVLDSPDPADAARRVFPAPHPATLRDFSHSLPPYMHRASPHLHELLSQALDGQAFAELSAT